MSGEDIALLIGMTLGILGTGAAMVIAVTVSRLASLDSDGER